MIFYDFLFSDHPRTIKISHHYGDLKDRSSLILEHLSSENDIREFMLVSVIVYAFVHAGMHRCLKEKKDEHFKIEKKDWIRRAYQRAAKV